MHSSSRQKPTLIDLRSNEGLDEGVGRLRVKAESVPKALEFRRLFEEGLFQAVPTRMEVLLDGVEGDVEYRALFRRQILLHLLRDILRDINRVVIIKRNKDASLDVVCRRYHDTAESVLNVRLSGHVILKQLGHVLYLRVRREILRVIR